MKIIGVETMGRLAQKGKTVECIARYLLEHGPSSALEITESMTFKNGKMVRKNRHFSQTTNQVRGLLQHHPLFKVWGLSTNPRIYDLKNKGDYYQWFARDPLGGEYTHMTHAERIQGGYLRG